MKKCVRCGWSKAAHRDPPWNTGFHIDPCHHYERPAPLWLRAYNRIVKTVFP